MEINIGKSFGNSLLTRERAKGLRQKIVNNLDEGVTLDFSKVKTLAHGFADEAFAKLVEKQGFNIFKEQVEFKNIDDKNKSIVKYVINQRLKK